MVTNRRILVATVLLLASGSIVGAAVALGGDAGRVLNGAGGVGWMSAAVLMVTALRRSAGSRWGVGIAVAVTLGLAWFVSASDLTAAAIGFGAAGAVVAAVTRVDRSAWALLVPALWLPFHVGSAVVRAAVSGEARIRTEPPPTAALVPLAMIIAAWGCGLVIERFVAGRASGVTPRRTRSAGRADQRGGLSAS